MRSYRNDGVKQDNKILYKDIQNPVYYINVCIRKYVNKKLRQFSFPYCLCVSMIENTNVLMEIIISNKRTYLSLMTDPSGR